MKEIAQVSPAEISDYYLIIDLITSHGDGQVRMPEQVVLEKLINNGDFWLGKSAGNIGTFMGFENTGKLGNIDIREVRTVVVIPEFRGNGAVSAVFNRASAIYPGDIFYGVTLESSVAMQTAFKKLEFRKANPIETIGVFGLPEDRNRNLDERIVWIKEPNNQL